MLTIADKIEALAGTVSGRALVAGSCAWLTSELIPTDAARARLRRWALAGRPVPDRGALAIVGAEPEMRAAVVGAIARLPDCVVAHLVTNTIVVLVGKRCNGWASHLPALTAPSEPAQIIALSDVSEVDETAAIFAHEAAHCFLSLPVLGAAPSQHAHRDAEAQTELMNTLVREWHVTDPRSFNRARDEWMVAELARSWGFTGRAVDADRFDTDLRAARAVFERGQTR